MSALANPIAARRLSELLADFASPPPGPDPQISGLTLDSRTLVPGDLFLACQGGRHGAAAFIADAVKRGACAIAAETPMDAHPLMQEYGRTVPVVHVPHLRERAGVIASRFFDHPSRDLAVIGVTGTNGKTSVTQFIAQLLQPITPCGVMGTLGYGLPGALHEASHTTPDAVTLQAELARLRDAGARAVAVEVSSHALDQHRVAGVVFDTVVFTNLSRDHLDYHGDMARYAEAKRRLLDWPGVQRIVINRDDAYGRRWWDELADGPTRIGYSLGLREAGDNRHQVRAQDIRLDAQGACFTLVSPWGECPIRSPLLGRFNIANLLAACAVALLHGLSPEQVAQRVAGMRTVPGRMERFGGGAQPLVVVDYAHTPDALEQALGALREHTGGKLWCVFGCGGERDRGKRPIMGGIAERFADAVIVTDDNPRGEDPRLIIEDIMSGMLRPERAEVLPDRSQAIAHAVAGARAGDVILVAGKGHEDYQLVGGERRFFSDRDQVAQALGERR